MDNTFTSDNHNHAHDDSVNNVDENLISFLLENHSHDNYVYPKHELFLKIKKLEFALHDSPHKIIYINPFISDFATLNLNYYQTVRQKLINQFDNSSYLLRAPPSLV
ncbi:MAG: hypothetical protein KDC55_12770 [Ignavibacteriae bacterium]|nr:hypothetical protein [Ignavibacteriota bacterium]